jgi:hypothetical protein
VTQDPKRPWPTPSSFAGCRCKSDCVGIKSALEAVLSHGRWS